MKTGFFDSISGNSSSARMIGFTIIAIALILSCLLAWWGKEDVVKCAGAIAIQFPAMTTPVLVYLFKNKQDEIQHEEVKQETALITKLPIL